MCGLLRNVEKQMTTEMSREFQNAIDILLIYSFHSSVLHCETIRVPPGSLPKDAISKARKRFSHFSLNTAFLNLSQDSSKALQNTTSRQIQFTATSFVVCASHRCMCTRLIEKHAGAPRKSSYSAVLSYLLIFASVIWSHREN